MSRMHKWLVCAVVLAMLGACTALPQKSFDTRLATAYQTLTTVRQSAATMVAGGKMPVDVGRQVLKLTDEARVTLDVAAKNKDEGSLDLALNVLKSVEGFLK